VSATFNTRYPRGGAALWTDGSVASGVVNLEFFGAPAPALDVPSIGASVSKGYNADTFATTAAITTQSSTALLVFAQWETTSTPPTITDSKGNTFGSPIRTLSPGGGSISNYIGAWFIASATGGSSHTFTATGASSTFPSIWVVEVPLAATVTHAGATSLTSPYNSGNLVTTGDTRLVGFVGAENTSAVTHTVNSAGFTKIPGVELNDGAAAWTGTVAQREAVAGTYSFEAAVTSSQDGGSILVALAKAAGGGAVTGTLAATESGSDTFASSGDVIVKGPLAATESGADTFAGAGDVIVQGSLSASEAGADTAAADGDVLVQGLLDAAEAGSDTFAATGGGSAAVTGSLDATEAGADTFAGDGDVVVQGALSASESGADTFASTGSVLVRGSLAATESGADTFAGSGAVPVSGALAASEAGSDTMAASGGVRVAGALAATEAGSDTFAADGAITAPGIIGALAAQEAGSDTAAADGAIDAPVLITAAQALLLRQVWLLHGLGGFLSVTQTTRAAGDVMQSISESGGEVTIETTGAGDTFTGDVGAMIEELAALHGLTVPLVVTQAGRTAGPISQTISAAGSTTIVLRT